LGAIAASSHHLSICLSSSFVCFLESPSYSLCFSCDIEALQRERRRERRREEERRRRVKEAEEK